MKRRGFLSLVATGAAALAVEKSLPAMFRQPVSVQGSRLRQLADAPALERYMMSFSPELGFQEIVEPGGITRLVCRSQILFRPDRLMFAPGTDLHKFSLCQLVMGDTPEADQVVGEVPAEFFAPHHYGAGVRGVWDVVRPGEEVVLALRNVSNADAEFRAAAMVGLRGQ
jgi:hypothetical protein